MRLIVYFSLALATATEPRSTMLVRTVPIGRLCCTRASPTTTLMTCTSIRAATTRTTATAATGGLFVPFKGSPNSERDAPVAKRSGWVSTKYELRSRPRVSAFNS